MGEYDIILVLGLGYFILKKAQKTVKQAQVWVEEEIVEPSQRLREGTSIHYSPYTQRYFSPDYAREGSIWRRLFG